MSRGILVDTDVTIDLLRGDSQAEALFTNQKSKLFFSSITVAEIYTGIRGVEEAAKVELLFSAFPVIAVTAEIAAFAGTLVQRFKMSHTLDLPDALIGATALCEELHLYTLNTKHYPMVPRLKPPYRKR